MDTFETSAKMSLIPQDIMVGCFMSIGHRIISIFVSRTPKHHFLLKIDILLLVTETKFQNIIGYWSILLLRGMHLNIFQEENKKYCPYAMNTNEICEQGSDFGQDILLLVTETKFQNIIGYWSILLLRGMHLNIFQEENKKYCPYAMNTNEICEQGSDFGQDLKLTIFWPLVT
ncbi:hypothetical protein GQR58_001975 [Nymphon striatum]|nr:hypothetical protein GQR58_001975 [Nymphon striatum]